MQFLKNKASTPNNVQPSNAKPATSYFSGLSLGEQNQKPKTNKKQNKQKRKTPCKGFIPQKFALDFTPPTIILQYRDPQSDKLYHHKMKIKKLEKSTPTKQALDYIKKKHYHFFMPKVIDQAQVQKLIEKLKSGLVGMGKSGIEDVSQEDDFEFDYEDDFQS